MIDIIPIPADYVRHAWGVAGPILERALAKGSGEYELSDLYDCCHSGHWQLWFCAKDGVVKAVSVTSISQYPRTKIAYMHAFAGELDRDVCVQAWNTLIEHAKYHGCSRVQFMGRPGWARSGVLPEGWQKTHEVYTVKV